MVIFFGQCTNHAANFRALKAHSKGRRLANYRGILPPIIIPLPPAIIPPSIWFFKAGPSLKQAPLQDPASVNSLDCSWGLVKAQIAIKAWLEIHDTSQDWDTRTASIPRGSWMIPQNTQIRLTR
jgi:hypothetical protein